jgi:hypothetical protein
LGYKLRAVVLMPFGAVLDGDLQDAAALDEVKIALAGPLCNLVTAGFFVALWWFFPDLYAYTDTAFYTSLTIALVNLLPAYPLDGGRILRAWLRSRRVEEGRVKRLCFAISALIASGLTGLFLYGVHRGEANLSILLFALFILFGAFGNAEKDAVYQKIDFALPDALARGVELKRVAVLESMPVKNAFRYLSKGTYLVLAAYDGKGEKRFEVPQNQLSEWFLRAPNPYCSLARLQEIVKK